jgi:glycosyltransferase involved in cell wall biosynthesis
MREPTLPDHAMKASVIVPTYNNEATIGAALDSVLAQRFEAPFEVIVVNDGSTDGTRAVLEKFGERIRVIDQENRGIAAARNAAIAVSTGEYIAPLDGDDTWTDDKLQKTVEVLDANPACVAVFSNATILDDAGTVISASLVAPGFDHSPTLDEMLGRRPWPITSGTLVVRREAILAIGGFPEEFGKDYGAEDLIAFLLLRERGEIKFVAENLTRYRLPTFEQRVEKYLRPLEWAGKSRGEPPEPEHYFRANRLWAKIVIERYGARGRKLADFAIDQMAREYVMIGMSAMHRGDGETARRFYTASLRYRPLRLKTWLRLGWAMLPGEVSQRLTPMLATRLRRSLSGPPFLEERPQ